MIEMKKWNIRSFKYGSYALAVTAIVVALIVLFNAVLGFDVVRNRLRIDITQNKMYSLSEPSLKLIGGLQKDVEIIILTEEKNFTTTEILEVLKQYTIKSNNKITLRFVDVERDPLFIERELDPEKLKGISDGSIVVKSGTKVKVVEQSDMVEYDYSTGYAQASGLKIEQSFSSAIQSVVADRTPVIYFAKGHGEMSIGEDLAALSASIASNNYEVKELSLNTAVPEDAAVIIFGSPKTDLLAQELEYLMAYMEKGGDAIFLMDVQTSDITLTNFNHVYERYSLALNNDFITEGDQNSYYGEANYIIPTAFLNDVTQNLDPNSQNVLMPNCRSVTIGQAEKEWITTQPLLKTSAKAVSYDLATSQPTVGSVLLGAIAEYQGSDSSKIALIGNAAFVTDDWMENAGDNGKRYVVSILNWMEDQTDTVMVPSKSLAAQPINLTEQSRFVAFIVLSFVLPLAIIGLGVFVWMRRKHL